MPLPPFPEIDWSRPWLDSVREAGAAVDARLAAAGWSERSDGAALRAALGLEAEARDAHNQHGMAIHFVAQSELPDGEAYEAFINRTGLVPTRDNLHDYFNALVWLAFPRLKQQVNALQAAQIAAGAIGQVRGAARDAATIFDENAALLVLRDDASGQALLAALREHAWPRAFLDLRAQFKQQAEVWLFGHALMEKLVAPYKAITAHCWVLLVADDFFTLDAERRRAVLDSALAAQFAGSGFQKTDCTPLPVLGVPGWWSGQDATFYADAAVFRPPRAGTVK